MSSKTPTSKSPPTFAPSHPPPSSPTLALRHSHPRGQYRPTLRTGVAVANHFENLDVNEEEAIGGFLARLECGGGDSPHPPLSSIQPSDDTKQSSVGMNALRPRQINFWQIMSDPPQSLTGCHSIPTVEDGNDGDQVAAKVTRTDENGSWILAYVLRFYAESETYDVQMKMIQVNSSDCQTTSFYRAIISKHPTYTSGVSADDNSGVGNAHKPRVKEVILKFEDDEDADGKTPHRRVPSRYVIPLPAKYYYEDDDDVDLTAPNSGV
ncbi:hypothetical protein QTG54_005426 [Skeletonema marinoi]|uniref:SGF29 C-terminal domain-containing protein n=1 Tax=Skeletonema marinoi TaxID=267567 RepID=A0AAD8YCB3_9STRA|nr:hypothetical protein QTG54_005426 [Skeletonema marinoi]